MTRLAPIIAVLFAQPVGIPGPDGGDLLLFAAVAVIIVLLPIIVFVRLTAHQQGVRRVIAILAGSLGLGMVLASLLLCATLLPVPHPFRSVGGFRENAICGAVACAIIGGPLLYIASRLMKVIKPLHKKQSPE